MFDFCVIFPLILLPWLWGSSLIWKYLNLAAHPEKMNYVIMLILSAVVPHFQSLHYVVLLARSLWETQVIKDATTHTHTNCSLHILKESICCINDNMTEAGYSHLLLLSFHVQGKKELKCSILLGVTLKGVHIYQVSLPRWQIMLSVYVLQMWTH